MVALLANWVVMHCSRLVLNVSDVESREEYTLFRGMCSSSATVGSTVVFMADFARVLCTIDHGGGRN